MTELFDDLLPVYWREVEVPVRRFRMSLAHDLVPHKAWGVNGARVENTGLAPMRYALTIPFVNHIAPGVNEGWLSAELYPIVFREFLLAFADRRAGHLQHPEFGLIACRPESLEVTWASEERNGVEVECSFVETLDDEVQHKVRNGLIELDVAAVNFDTMNSDLRKIVPKLPKYQTTFADLARMIQGLGDQVALMSYRVNGQIASILYRVDNVKRSIDQQKNPLTWEATRFAERIESAAHDVKQQLALNESRRILYYRVREDTTLAAVAAQLPGAKLGEVMMLNPRLMASPVVPAGSVVRYYATKAS